jgi:uncharacterized protein (TIGR02391 family)
MATVFDWFEQVVRRSPAHVADDPGAETSPGSELHPFDVRNVHPGFPAKVRKLFDDGHCAEATFAAFKWVEKYVIKHSGKKESGRALMMTVFDKSKPLLKLNPLATMSDEDEQEGYRFMFSGAVMGIRNPGGHEVELSDDPDVCLDHLAFASLLIRRLERSGFK